jgi:hypothetical protein
MSKTKIAYPFDEWCMRTGWTYEVYQTRMRDAELYKNGRRPVGDNSHGRNFGPVTSPKITYS